MFLERIISFFTHSNKKNTMESRISFPTYEELSFEQKEATNLPFDKNM